MSDALYFTRMKGGKVRCTLCPHVCLILEGSYGRCRVRKNIDGKLSSMVYGKPSAVSLDPVEKKPLFHFLPGTKTFSIGTAGCNLSCLNCQNFDLSQRGIESQGFISLPPKDAVERAISMGAASISYTYNEPTVFFEYMLDCAKLAHEKGLKNIMVTNGFINPKPLKELCPYIDAANIDLKSFKDSFYNEICGARLQPVLDAITFMHKRGIWIELTWLLIPGENDSKKEIEEATSWVADISGSIPFHFSRFMPLYRMRDYEQTPLSSMRMASDIAKKRLKYVYLGNIDEGADTCCPKCRKALIKRHYYDTEVIQTRCSCGFELEGVFI